MLLLSDIFLDRQRVAEPPVVRRVVQQPSCATERFVETNVDARAASSPL